MNMNNWQKEIIIILCYDSYGLNRVQLDIMLQIYTYIMIFAYFINKKI